MQILPPRALFPGGPAKSRAKRAGRLKREPGRRAVPGPPAAAEMSTVLPRGLGWAGWSACVKERRLNTRQSSQSISTSRLFTEACGVNVVIHPERLGPLFPRPLGDRQRSSLPKRLPLHLNSELLLSGPILTFHTRHAGLPAKVLMAQNPVCEYSKVKGCFE